MRSNFLQLNIDTNKIILSSKSLFYKTESFIKQTRYISNIDMLLSKLSQSLILNKSLILEGEKEVKSDTAFMIELDNKLFTFIVKFGYQVAEDLNKNDIVFLEYIHTELNKDIKVDEYIKSDDTLPFIIRKITKKVNESDFNKLYLLSTVSGINLPKLSDEQKGIVEIVDKNVLVQGVAGSGKTNICIDKIIFNACKNFRGKTLYTTFSRGLLVDTKLKVEMFKSDLQEVLNAHKNGLLTFLDSDHKKALENRLNIYFFSDDDNQIFNKIEKVIFYLENKVDYLLIEDIYRNKFYKTPNFVNQDYFIHTYSKNLQNHQIEKSFVKLSRFSKEIIYKEIYGMIFGFYNLETCPEIISLDEYIEARKNSFSRQECETIYQIALDYKKYLSDNNLIDNNIATREIINSLDDNFEYSLSIIDEVQDYTQVNLCLFKKLSLKLFCVGDALQMINPSYFNFGYVKNLLYEKDLTEVKVLKYNYRNTQKIGKIIDELAELNRQEFGTHNFVVGGRSVDSGLTTTAVYFRGNDFVNRVAKSGYDNFTFVVATDHEKKELQKFITDQEVLTVSEIKGLERGTVVAFNILSSNLDKWKEIDYHKINHKTADENSIYRYYYNLFYVSLSRAKQNIFVVEKDYVKQFDEFFKHNFSCQDLNSTIASLNRVVSKVEFTQNEARDRVREFIKLEQFDNARFMANKLKNNAERIDALRTIEIYEKYIHFGKYRDAGIKFWEYGMIEEAKNQFKLSKDHILIELIGICSNGNSKDLNINIIDYFTDVMGNKVAEQFILETIKKDVDKLKNSFHKIKQNFKKDRK